MMSNQWQQSAVRLNLIMAQSPQSKMRLLIGVDGHGEPGSEAGSATSCHGILDKGKLWLHSPQASLYPSLKVYRSRFGRCFSDCVFHPIRLMKQKLWVIP